MTNPTETWRGHYPIASFVFEALSKRHLAEDSMEIDQSERSLYVVCAFWAAAAGNSLQEYLGSDEIARLRIAREAFSKIGAVRVASVLHMRIDDLMRTVAPARQKRIIVQTEDQLAHSEDDVDELIAAFAAKHLSRDVFNV